MNTYIVLIDRTNRYFYEVIATHETDALDRIDAYIKASEIEKGKMKGVIYLETKTIDISNAVKIL